MPCRSPCPAVPCAAIPNAWRPAFQLRCMSGRAAQVEEPHRGVRALIIAWQYIDRCRAAGLPDPSLLFAEGRGCCGKVGNNLMACTPSLAGACQATPTKQQTQPVPSAPSSLPGGLSCFVVARATRGQPAPAQQPGPLHELWVGGGGPVLGAAGGPLRETRLRTSKATPGGEAACDTGPGHVLGSM